MGTMTQWLVVIAIIGVLAAVFLPALARGRNPRLEQLAIDRIDIVSQSLASFPADHEGIDWTDTRLQSFALLVYDFEKVRTESKPEALLDATNSEEFITLLGDAKALIDGLNLDLENFSEDLSEERERAKQEVKQLHRDIDSAGESVAALQTAARERRLDFMGNLIMMCTLVVTAIVLVRTLSTPKDSSKELASELSRFDKRLEQLETRKSDSEENRE